MCFASRSSSNSSLCSAGSVVQGNSEFRALHRPVEYPTYISDTARSFIQGLLDTNEKTRIGCDENGIGEYGVIGV